MIVTICFRDCQFLTIIKTLCLILLAAFIIYFGNEIISGRSLRNLQVNDYFNVNLTSNTKLRDDSKRIIVCYYTIPSGKNSSKELLPSSIDLNLCSHLIIGFSSVQNCSINLGDNEEIYKQFANLKQSKPDVKFMISVGGMNELEEGYPRMVFNHTNRKIFIRSVLQVIQEYKLDGLDLDWEFPAWANPGSRQRINFVQLIYELRKEFDHSGRNLVLSAAVAAPRVLIDECYNIPEIAEHIDFVNLMSYDYSFYTWYYPLTGLNSPLYPPGPNFEAINTSAHAWFSKGMPKEKIVVGIPTYGHTYLLDNRDNHNLNSPARRFGDLGNQGFVGYSAICDFLASGATRKFVEASRVPYAYKDYNWISYDDEQSVKEKAEWIRNNGFGGAMLFSLNTDDWSGSCSNSTKFPLARTIVKALNKSVF